MRRWTESIVAKIAILGFLAFLVSRFRRMFVIEVAR